MPSFEKVARAPFSLVLCMVLSVAATNYVRAQGTALSVSPATLAFASQAIGTASAAETMTLRNSGAVPLTISGFVLAGTFYGDYSIVSPNTCVTTLAPGASCAVAIIFTPVGTGSRPAKLLVLESLASTQSIQITGSGAGACTSVSDCSFQLLNERVLANQQGFFVYKDGDSAFNHGYPSGLFGTIDLSQVKLNSSCVDDPTSPTGCSTDSSALEGTRGTVFSLTYPPLTGENFVGLDFIDPENYSSGSTISHGYNLTPATSVQFEARSPGATPIMVQFGVGGCVSDFYPLTSSWARITIPIDTLFPSPGAAPYFCPPDLTHTNILFSVSTNAAMSPSGGTVLLDNIQFLPVPSRQVADAGGQIFDPKANSFPLGDQTFGVVPAVVTNSQIPIPPDQVNRNFAAIYESAATLLALLRRGQPNDVRAALEIADTFDYALHHENHGDPLPMGPDGSVGLHDAYQGGDIALLNALPGVGGALAGDSRLAGFSSGSTFCNGFCLVLDGATGGNNAWAILALAAAYLQTANPGSQTILQVRRPGIPIRGNLKYLEDAETIGRWIIATMLDQSGSGFGGYFVGFPDNGAQPKTLILGKSTENNADIFAAFSLLAEIETTNGNQSSAAAWTQAANIAGDFVMQMFDKTNGRFNSGTVSAKPPSPPNSPGNCQTPFVQLGNDILNTCDFLDSTSFVTLAMAGASRYSAFDWSVPLNYVLNLPPPISFSQSVMAEGLTFDGFDIVPGACAPVSCAATAPSTGISWEFTGQVAATCEYLSAILSISAFQNCSHSYVAEISQAQNHAPFGDGFGLPASTLQNGDTLAPVSQCLESPFQCFPERVGLAASNWAIYSDLGFNPLTFSAIGLSRKALAFTPQPIGVPSSLITLQVVSRGTSPVGNIQISVAGPNAMDFSEQDNCPRLMPLSSGAACTVTLTFTPGGSGARNATLAISDSALASPQTCALSGTGVPPQDFTLSINGTEEFISKGNSATFSVTASGNAQPITLSAVSNPSGLGLTLSPSVISSGSSSTLTVNPTLSTLAGFYMVTITGTGPMSTHEASVSLYVTYPVTLSAPSVIFPAQGIATTSPTQKVMLMNVSLVTVNLSALVLSGNFYGDYSESDNCGSTLAAGASCAIAVAFTPTGTGSRNASLIVLDAGGGSLGEVGLNGTGLGSCSGTVDCGYALLNQRSTASQSGFFVYQDADSGTNQGFPSGLFPASLPGPVTINSGCIDDPASPSGCSTAGAVLDGTRGTVLQIVFPALAPLQFVGLDFQDPQDYNPATNVGKGYNLLGATAIEFDVRSPDSAMVQFGAGNCVTPTFSLSKNWTHMKIPVTSLSPPGGVYPPPVCPPDLSSVNLLFAVQTVAQQLSQGQETILLDNIQYTPTPITQTKTLGLPVSTQTFGVVPQQILPIPTDQVNRNIATIYESALTILALLNRNQGQDTTNALRLAQTLDYALNHDNHGDPVPTAPGSAYGCFSGAQAQQCGLHSAYINGSIGFFNAQPSTALGQAGDVRLAGFSSGEILCGKSQFCLVLDGASGGNNAWAVLAFLQAYRKSGQMTYLNDALAVANWIVANLRDASGAGYGGYFVGYSDGGSPKELILGKATAQNAVIFAAFNQLAQVESALGNSGSSTQWTSSARVAGDFVVRMFDKAKGRFYAGTINTAGGLSTSPGSCPDTSLQQGNDIINTCDSLDSDTYPILAMAISPLYEGALDWRQPMNYSLNHFLQTVTVDGQPFEGFGLITTPTVGLNGIAWEYTSQAVAAMNVLNQAYSGAGFEANVSSLVNQIQLAQKSAPFGDGQGVVASTLQFGDNLPPVQQCLATPFACIPERVGLAATAWAIFASLTLNPLSI